MLDTKPTTERDAIPLWPDAGRRLSLGKNATYAAAARGEIPTIRIGNRLLVPMPRLRRMLGEID